MPTVPQSQRQKFMEVAVANTSCIKLLSAVFYLWLFERRERIVASHSILHLSLPPFLLKLFHIWLSICAKIIDIPST